MFEFSWMIVSFGSRITIMLSNTTQHLLYLCMSRKNIFELILQKIKIKSTIIERLNFETTLDNISIQP